MTDGRWRGRDCWFRQPLSVDLFPQLPFTSFRGTRLVITQGRRCSVSNDSDFDFRDVSGPRLSFRFTYFAVGTFEDLSFVRWAGRGGRASVSHVVRSLVPSCLHCFFFRVPHSHTSSDVSPCLYVSVCRLYPGAPTRFPSRPSSLPAARRPLRRTSSIPCWVFVRH